MAAAAEPIAFLEGLRVPTGPLAGEPIRLAGFQKAGTLDLTDTDEALVMEADLTPEIQAATWVRTSLPGCGPGSSWACRPAFAAPASRPR